MFELIRNILDLLDKVRVVWRKVPDFGNRRLSLFPSILLGKEPRRFVADNHEAKEQHSRESLDGEGNDILGSACMVQADRVVDPKSNHPSGNDKELIEASKQSTYSAGSVFGDIDRVDRGGGANSKTYQPVVSTSSSRLGETSGEKEH